jgi:hypothetical protein
VEDVIAIVGRLIDESQPLQQMRIVKYYEDVQIGDKFVLLSPIIEAEIFVKLKAGGAATLKGRKGMGSYVRCCVDHSRALLGILE